MVSGIANSDTDTVLVLLTYYMYLETLLDHPIFLSRACGPRRRRRRGVTHVDNDANFDG